MEDRFFRLKAKVQEFNKGATEWGKNVHTTAIGNLNALDVKSGGTKKSQDLKAKFLVKFYHQDTGFNVQRIWRVGFGFPSTGAFLHYGVGRGYERQGGKTVRTAKSETDNPRRPKNWFNPVVENKLQEMDKVVDDYGTGLALNAINLKLPES